MLIRFGKTTKQPRPSVATIGNFDGLHLGHQKVIAQVVAHAKKHELLATVITFEPLSRPVARLMPFSQKLAYLRQLGVEQVICLPFKTPLILTSAYDFIMNYLIRDFNVQHLIVCESFRFGYQQAGDADYLQQIGQANNLGVDIVPLYHLAGAPMSSTRIRQALKDGNLAQANALLGRHFAIQGRVKPGDRRGRLLGFATANISLKNKAQVLSGVFVTQVVWQNKTYHGVANIGTRPTLAGNEIRLEVHLLDFSENLYGERITVYFIHKLRSEMRFENVACLSAQIARDVQAARMFIAAQPIKTKVTA